MVLFFFLAFLKKLNLHAQSVKICFAGKHVRKGSTVNLPVKSLEKVREAMSAFYKHNVLLMCIDQSIYCLREMSEKKRNLAFF